MGLKLGKATLHDAVKPFCKVGKASVMKLITAYQNISDGFGLSMDETSEILAELHDDLQLAPDVVKLLATHLFLLLDTDENGLVDGLELLATLAFCSGMRKTDMLEFSLTLYDFNNSAALTFDELVLALKSCCAGLCKVHAPRFADLSRELLSIPAEERLEQLASLAFSRSVENGASPAFMSSAVELSLSRKNIKDLIDELLRLPEICSWLSFFCNYSEERDVPQYTQAEIADVIVGRVDPLTRTQAEQDVVQWSVHYPALPKDRSNNDKWAHDGAQWREQVAHLAPLSYANAGVSRALPNVRVCMDWVYGCAAENVRKNVFYTFAHDIAYHVGKLAILYSLKSHAQRVFSGHSEEITVLQIHPKLRFVASGEAGDSPAVLVWSTETLEVLHSSRGSYKAGISQLGFSGDGELLIVVDNAPVKEMTVLRWRENFTVFKANIDAEVVHSALVLPKDVFAVSADSDLWFWTRFPEGYLRREGVYMKNKAKEAITCAVPANHSDALVTGTISGKIMLWQGINCVRQVRAHAGPVNALHGCSDGFLSAGKDSRIRMWSYAMEPRFLFDVSQFGVSTSVRSVCLSRDATTILFSTADAEVFEISAIDGSDLRGGPVVHGHATGSINCVDTHPSKLEFVTVGSDRTVRITDMRTKALLRTARLDTEGRAVAYNPVGDVIAVGTDNAPTSGCMFVVLNEETLSIVHSARDTRYPVTVIKFSPEGETLAVGTADGGILLYSVHDDYELVARCSRHTSAIIGIDFSTEGEWLRSNSIAGELFFFNADDGAFQTNTPSMRDVQWSTHECVFSWHTQGVHSLEQVVERVTCCAAPSTEDKPLLVCGSTLGQLRVYSFPAASDGAECFRFPMHCDAVADVRFSFDGKTLLSVGKTDRCVLQWRIQQNEESSEIEAPGSENNEPPQELLFEFANGEDVLQKFAHRPPVAPVGLLNDGPQSVSQEFAWSAQIVSPSNETPINQNLPDLSLCLQHVYGFETTSLRNNLCCISKQEIVYTCSCFAIVWNNATQSQRVYKMHTNKITAFAFSRAAAVVATGELGENANVFVWDPQNLRTLFILPEAQRSSVCALAFSAQGSLLCVAGNDRMHTVSVYDWRHCALHCKLFAGESKIMGVTFCNDATLLTVGVQHIKFWQDVRGKFPQCISPSLAGIGRVQTFLCCAAFAAVQVVGTAEGDLYVFESLSLKQVVKAHVGGVFSLCVSPDLSRLFTGGQDGALRAWDSSFECTREVALESLSKNFAHAVRAIAVYASGDSDAHYDTDAVLVGTQGAEVLEISLREGTLRSDGVCVKGHHTRACGLAAHPSLPIFATTGDDALLRLWDLKTRTSLRTIKLELASRAVCFSSDGRLLAMGFGNGRRVKGKLHAKEGALLVVSYENMKTLFDGKDSSLAVTCVAFSPDDALLAAGSEDCCVYAYAVNEHFSLRYTVRSHQAPLRSLDFSVSGRFLLSSDVAERIFYTLSSTGVSSSFADDVKDEFWCTHDNALSWAAAGLSLSLPRGATLSRCAKSRSGLFILAANSQGDVSLSRFPAPQRTGFIVASRHAGSVSGLVWTAEDEGFLSLGAEDCAVLHWSVRPVCEDAAVLGTQALIPASVSQLFEREITQQIFSSSPFRVRAEEKEEDDRLTSVWTSMISQPVKVIATTAETLPVMSEMFVHGWQRNPQHGVLHYNCEGDVIFHAGNVGVVVDRNGIAQRHYLGHCAEISALTITFSRRLVASADTQQHPELHVWDAMVCKRVTVLSGFTRHYVRSLAFSRSAKQLVALGGDSLQSVSLFCSPSANWSDAFFCASASVAAIPMCWCLFAESRDFSLVCGGADGFLHCFRPQSGTFVPTRVCVEQSSMHRALLCAVETLVVDDRLGVEIPSLLLGTSDGLLLVVSGANKLLRRVAAHNSELFAVALAPQSQGGYDASLCGTEAELGAHRVLTVGADGFLCYWSAGLQPLQKIDIANIIPQSAFSSVASAIVFSAERNSAALGFAQGDVWELSLGTTDSVLLCESHYNPRGELHGLAWNPMSTDEFATFGDEGVLKVWHASARYCTRRKAIKFPSRAIAWSPRGDVIAVGIGSADRERMTPKDGAIVLVESSSLNILLEEKKAKKWINGIQFSPSGEEIAAASADGRVYIVDLTLATLLVIDIGTHRQALHLDFSSDSSMLRIAYQPDRLVFFNLASVSVEQSPLAAKDLDWATHSCPFSWNTQGLFSDASLKNTTNISSNSPMDGAEPLALTALTVNISRSLLFVAYDNGEIRMYRYPQIDVENSSFVMVARLPSFASKLECNPTGTALVAIDAQSRILFQWVLSTAADNKNKSMIALQKMRKKKI